MQRLGGRHEAGWFAGKAEERRRGGVEREGEEIVAIEKEDCYVYCVDIAVWTINQEVEHRGGQ